MSIKSNQMFLSVVTFAIVCIAIYLAYNLYTSVNIDNKYTFHFWALAVAFVFAILQQLLYPALSLSALKGVGHTVGYFQMLWIVLVSTTANSTVPFPAGIPVRAILQKKVLGVPYTSSASAIMVESTVGYGCLISSGVLSCLLWLRPSIIQETGLYKSQLAFGAIVVGVLFALLLLIIVLKSVKVKALKHINNAWKLVVHTEMKTLLILTIINMFSYALFLIRFLMILYSIGLTVSPGPLFAAMVLSILVGVVSFVPMGLGFRDVSMASLLVMLGVPLDYAATVVAIDRVLITLPYLIGSIIGIRILGKSIFK